MDDTFMSSKGQVVIPKIVRDAVGLRRGSKLRVDVEDGKILLTPVAEVTPEDLYGCIKGFDLTADLETERAEEIAREEASFVQKGGEAGYPRKRGRKR